MRERDGARGGEERGGVSVVRAATVAVTKHGRLEMRLRRKLETLEPELFVPLAFTTAR